MDKKANYSTHSLKVLLCNKDDSKQFNKYSKDLPNKLDWTNYQESIYKENMTKARLTNRDQSSAATFADCALASFIYTYINTKTTEQQRGELLDRLLEGEKLTNSELRFLTYSSRYLACFLDRQVYQQAVLLTKTKIIEDVGYDDCRSN